MTVRSETTVPTKTASLLKNSAQTFGSGLKHTAQTDIGCNKRARRTGSNPQMYMTSQLTIPNTNLQFSVYCVKSRFQEEILGKEDLDNKNAHFQENPGVEDYFVKHGSRKNRTLFKKSLWQPIILRILIYFLLRKIISVITRSGKPSSN